MSDKRVQRKKIENEIRRLNNILNYSKVDDSERKFIENNIKYLQSEIGYIKWGVYVIR